MFKVAIKMNLITKISNRAMQNVTVVKLKRQKQEISQIKLLKLKIPNTGTLQALYTFQGVNIVVGL